MARETSFDPSQRFECTVPQSVIDNFRRAVFLKHKTLWGVIGAEAARALSIHADRMLMEANGVTVSSPSPETQDAVPPGFIEFAGVFDDTRCSKKEEQP